MSDTLIPTRVLGRQGLIVPALGLGCMGMSQSYGPADEQDGQRLWRWAQRAPGGTRHR